MRLVQSVFSVPSDVLRPPSPLDLAASAYKDWLHLNVFVPDVGVAAIVNTSLHGDPLAPSALGIGTFLVHQRERPSAAVAEVDVRSRHDPTVSVEAAAIGIGGTARIALGDTGQFLSASARTADAELELSGFPAADPIEVEHPIPFGSGWISWRAVPRLTLDGFLRVGRREFDLSGAIGYHDHNWGRWSWGDDIGWRWGTFPAERSDVSVTVAHRTDRQHRAGAPIARVQIGRRSKDFPRGTVDIRYGAVRSGSLRRLPGALAALRSDRQRPDLPAVVSVTIDDGFDRLETRFSTDEAVQLVTAEPARPGHTFIHELFGTFVVVGRFGDEAVRASGHGVFEHVD